MTLPAVAQEHADHDAVAAAAGDDHRAVGGGLDHACPGPPAAPARPWRAARRSRAARRATSEQAVDQELVLQALLRGRARRPRPRCAAAIASRTSSTSTPARANAHRVGLEHVLAPVAALHGDKERVRQAREARLQLELDPFREPRARHRIRGRCGAGQHVEAEHREDRRRLALDRRSARRAGSGGCATRARTQRQRLAHVRAGARSRARTRPRRAPSSSACASGRARRVDRLLERARDRRSSSRAPARSPRSAITAMRGKATSG